jgi:hypothetical protein
MDDTLDRDDEPLDLTQLIDLGLTAEEARAVLVPHSALSRREVRERYAMMRYERGDRP